MWFVKCGIIVGCVLLYKVRGIKFFFGGNGGNWNVRYFDFGRYGAWLAVGNWFCRG